MKSAYSGFMTYHTIKIPETPSYTPRPWVIHRRGGQEKQNDIGVPLELPLPLDDEEGRTEIIPDRGYPDRKIPESGYVTILPDEDTGEITIQGIETLL